ncbi:hypothetical protein IFM89_027686 [Coptis chinensis]|uniref:Bacterial Ig-like domain-containing protein n=1 Tax=Coptis chinensis TaxID=261450 RepID=A0A835IY83_9MAGN|nr:hypothetical protein IFM89_027686 [Coptis chinensis]
MNQLVQAVDITLRTRDQMLDRFGHHTNQGLVPRWPVLLQVAESTVIIRFDRTPLARSRFSTAIFRYSIVRLDGSSAYTIPPTASISTERSYTNAERIAITIAFSEPCTGQGGFKCINVSTCDIVIDGLAAQVDASTFHIVKPDIKYRLTVVLSSKIVYEPVIVKMVDNFCTDQAGNSFIRTNSSDLIVHVDRRPVEVDLWTSVPSYELKLRNVSRTQIITVKLQYASIVGRSGTPVSYVTPITFMYDTKRLNVRLSTNSPRVTKESNIDVLVEFMKPVFGFQTSGVETGGGRIIRQVFRELSKSMYSVRITGTAHGVISVLVPEAIVNDVAGNQNLASNRIEVRQFLSSLHISSSFCYMLSIGRDSTDSSPAISVALHSFVTAGLLTTSLAAALFSLSSANLCAIGALTRGTTDIVVSDPSMNLLGMVGHLQVFVLSDWISVSLPISYSETTKGLRWLIPHEKLPWKKEKIQNNDSPGQHYKLSLKARNFSFGHHYEKETDLTKELNLNTSSYLEPKFPSTTDLALEVNKLHGKQNLSMISKPYGKPLESNEYSIYFLRGEPLPALLKNKEKYTRWKDLEMNLFWLGMAGGGLLIIHTLILLFLRWRTGSTIHGTLSVPKFELFLLIFMIPCICQSSAFIIRGGTTRGIITGCFLLAIPTALILSVCLFLVKTIFVGGLVQYKEVKHTGKSESCHSKLLALLFFGRPTKGRWFLREGTSSFLLRFGFLFEDRKGPPVFVLVDKNDPTRVPKWIDSGQSGIGRMRALNFYDGNEETQISMSKKLLGCARSAYLILDLLRRVGFGIISGAYSSRRQSQGIIALVLTVGQLLYLVTLQPYIRRGIHAVESVSLLCEAAIFGLSLSVVHSNPFKEQTMGFIMLSLLFISFLSQLVSEWYILVRWLLRLPQSSTPSFKLGVKFIAKGLVLPFLPRKYWQTLLPGSSQPSTGFVPVLPTSPETEFIRENEALQHVNPLSSMTATVALVLSTGSQVLQTTEQTSCAQGPSENRQNRLGPKSELRKLRELAKASFKGSSKDEGSSSYAPKEQSGLNEPSSSNTSQSSSPRKRLTV